MSSLDSQFLCLGTIFTNDIVAHGRAKPLTDEQLVWIARCFIVGIVALVYVISMMSLDKNVFDLAVWCFSGFGSLTPIVFAALYWRRATLVGLYASVGATAVTWLFFFIRAGGEESLVFGIMPVAWIFLASAAGMVLGSLCSKPPSQETIDKFFPGGKRA